MARLDVTGLDAGDGLGQSASGFRLTPERFAGPRFDHAAPRQTDRPAAGRPAAQNRRPPLRDDGFRAADDRDRDRGHRRPRARHDARRDPRRGARDRADPPEGRTRGVEVPDLPHPVAAPAGIKAG